MWIFGYGSLIWKPGFEYVERHVGFVRGWQRRFYQGSFDHRGVPGKPGRVVTLLPEETELTWGVAFRVEGDAADAITARLDHREKGGYERWEVPVYQEGQQGEVRCVVEQALIYVATVSNPNYLGFATPEEIALQVFQAHGPSGPNDEYVLRLAESLRKFEVEDPHVFAVDRAVRNLISANDSKT